MNQNTRYKIVEVVLLLVAALSGAGIIINLFEVQHNQALLFLSGLLFTVSLLLSLRLWLDPDRIRASQSNAMLSLASQSFGLIGEKGIEGADVDDLCKLLLPSTAAAAVGITNTEKILGYAGIERAFNMPGGPLRTHATRQVLADGKMRVLRDRQDIGLPPESVLNAAIVAPLTVGNEVVGTLKFFYRNPRSLNSTEESIASGFAELISVQAAAQMLDQQRELASSMELKMLQSQINPHFLFNTLNTITALIRTEPDRARDLLREFATFYRRVLENSSDLITLEQELEQTQRYLSFELARFGEERLRFVTEIDPGLEKILVPSFMLQPLVENAVRHGMPSEGLLTITCTARMEDCDTTIVVADDGVGMSPEASESLNGPSAGLGIAMQNIKERIAGYYGGSSHMEVESEPGKGTRVVLFLENSCKIVDA